MGGASLLLWQSQFQLSHIRGSWLTPTHRPTWHFRWIEGKLRGISSWQWYYYGLSRLAEVGMTGTWHTEQVLGMLSGDEHKAWKLSECFALIRWTDFQQLFEDYLISYIHSPCLNDSPTHVLHKLTFRNSHSVSGVHDYI